MNKFSHVSFLSDYGTQDEFVGVVKAVIADIAPHVNVIDLVHDVTPFDVRAGSLALARCVPYVPTGVVLAVVDPGVGGSRRAIAISVGGGKGVFIGPDNGLLPGAVALAGGPDQAVVLNNSAYQLASPGDTFAGRDIFAPAAAHLCNGVALTDLGDEIDPSLLLPGVVPLPREEGGQLLSEVTWIDRFGNCQLNVGPEEINKWGSPLRVIIGASDPTNQIVRSVPVVRNFADIGGGIGLVVDSYGMLALCVDRGSAAAELQLGPTDMVVIAQDPSAGAGVATSVRLGTKK